MSVELYHRVEIDSFMREIIKFFNNKMKRIDKNNTITFEKLSNAEFSSKKKDEKILTTIVRFNKITIPVYFIENVEEELTVKVDDICIFKPIHGLNTFVFTKVFLYAVEVALEKKAARKKG